jgi:hypothetical protein
MGSSRCPVQHQTDLKRFHRKGAKDAKESKKKKFDGRLAITHTRIAIASIATTDTLHFLSHFFASFAPLR